MSTVRQPSSSPRFRPSPQRGITLVELLIAVTVVGILATIAVPSYSEYTRRAARSDAQLTLHAAATWLERRYAECNKYNRIDASTPTPCTTPLNRSDLPGELQGSPSGAGLPRYRYDVSISELTAQSYTVQAVPRDTRDQCGTMRITHTGERQKTGTLSLDDCWRR